MKKQSSENKLVITEEFIFDQNKLSKDPNNHFNYLHLIWVQTTCKGYHQMTLAKELKNDFMHL